jgi:hypothetical protein
MNDLPDDIEAELLAMRPGAPSPELARRIEAELGRLEPAPARRLCHRRWLAWSVCATATVIGGLVVCLLLRPRGTDVSSRASRASAPVTTARAGETTSGSFRRINAADYLLDAADEGVVYTSASTGLRKIRCQVLSTARWRDEHQNLTVQVLVPAEEVVFVPLRVQ